MEKLVIKISDILDDTRPNSIQVEIAETGKPAWLPRRVNGRDIEFFRGRVVLPLWLARRILGDVDFTNPDFPPLRRKLK